MYEQMNRWKNGPTEKLTDDKMGRLKMNICIDFNARTKYRMTE